MPSCWPVAALARPAAAREAASFFTLSKRKGSRIFQAQDGYDRRDSEQQQVTADEELKTATIVAIPNNNKLLRTRIAGGWFVGPEG